jgi:hypothetical protein
MEGAPVPGSQKHFSDTVVYYYFRDIKQLNGSLQMDGGVRNCG